MSQSGQNMRAIAKRLSSYEADENKLSRTSAAGTFIVCEKLSHPLIALSGINGFRTLLSRALALAGNEVGWLRAVRIKADGSLEPPPEIAKLDQQEIHDGEIALAAELLGLLATFIGEPLTLSLVREVWPRTLISDTEFNKKDSTRLTI
jgi:hypothetical protein